MARSTRKLLATCLLARLSRSLNDTLLVHGVHPTQGHQLFSTLDRNDPTQLMTRQVKRRGLSHRPEVTTNPRGA